MSPIIAMSGGGEASRGRPMCLPCITGWVGLTCIKIQNSKFKMSPSAFSHHLLGGYFISKAGPALKHKRPGQGPPQMLVGFGVAAPIPANKLVGVDFKLAV